MAESFFHPAFNRLPQFAQASLEKMIRAFNHHKLFRFRRRRDQRLQLRPRAELIACPADKQFRLRALAQEIEGINSRRFRFRGHRNRRNAYSNQSLHPRIRTRSPQPDRRAKRESRKQQRQVKLRVQPIEGSANVFDFPVAVIVFAVAQSGASKVEAQHGKTKTIQRLHGVEHDLVMQSPAKQWMRMADDSRVRRVLCAGIEQRFQSSRRAFEEERFYGRTLGDHSNRLQEVRREK